MFYKENSPWRWPTPWFPHRRDRELKKAKSNHWKGDLDQDALHSVGRQLCYPLDCRKTPASTCCRSAIARYDRC
jgi:hypothetical protein